MVQVDFANRAIRLPGRDTKTKKPRTLPLNVDELYQMFLLAKQSRDENWPQCEHVFQRFGEPIKSFEAAWRSACKKLGWWDAEKKRATKLFHDFRRTGVRNLRKSGVGESIAMRISGHKTVSVFRRYDIGDDAELHDAMRKVERRHKEQSSEISTNVSTQPPEQVVQ